MAFKMLLKPSIIHEVCQPRPELWIFDTTCLLLESKIRVYREEEIIQPPAMGCHRALQCKGKKEHTLYPQIRSPTPRVGSVLDVDMLDTPLREPRPRGRRLGQ